MKTEQKIQKKKFLLKRIEEFNFSHTHDYVMYTYMHICKYMYILFENSYNVHGGDHTVSKYNLKYKIFYYREPFCSTF